MKKDLLFIIFAGKPLFLGSKLRVKAEMKNGCAASTLLELSV